MGRFADWSFKMFCFPSVGTVSWYIVPWKCSHTGIASDLAFTILYESVTRSVMDVMTEDLGLQINFKWGLPIQFQCCKWVQILPRCSGNFYSIVWFSGSNWFSKNFEVVNQELNPNSGSGWFSSGWFSSGWFSSGWFSLVVHSLVWWFRTDPGQH